MPNGLGCNVQIQKVLLTFSLWLSFLENKFYLVALTGNEHRTSQLIYGQIIPLKSPPGITAGVVEDILNELSS